MHEFTVGDGWGQQPWVWRNTCFKCQQEETKGKKERKENSYLSREFTFWEKLAAEQVLQSLSTHLGFMSLPVFTRFVHPWINWAVCFCHSQQTWKRFPSGKMGLVFRLIRYKDNNFWKGCIFNVLIGGLKGGAVCNSLRCRIMEGVECQLNSILLGTFHSLLCNTWYICFLLLKNLERFEEQISEAVTTHTCGILKTFADCVELVLFHSREGNYYSRPQDCKS